PLLAQYHVHEDVVVDGRCDDTNNNRKNIILPVGETPLPNRIHTRIVVSTFGRPIKKFCDATQLLVVLRDAIEGHWQLFHVANILHRDISINNIMIGPDGNGFLIDLDYAVYVDTDREPQSPHRTGTFPFMSIAVLE